MKSKITTAYAQHDDMTFIMKDIYNENGDIVSTECVGFYFGSPSETDTAEFIGKLKAEFI